MKLRVAYGRTTVASVDILLPDGTAQRVVADPLTARTVITVTGLVLTYGMRSIRIAKDQFNAVLFAKVAAEAGLLRYVLWIEEGTTPKYLRKTRLKCDELEKPQENATSVMVLPACVSNSWRQFCNLVCQI